MFDTLFDDYPETQCRLSSLADIFHEPIFKSAVVKVQRSEYYRMTRKELVTVQLFELSTDFLQSSNFASVSCAEGALICRTNVVGSNARKYHCFALLATHMERLRVSPFPYYARFKQPPQSAHTGQFRVSDISPPQ